MRNLDRANPVRYGGYEIATDAETANGHPVMRYVARLIAKVEKIVRALPEHPTPSATQAVRCRKAARLPEQPLVTVVGLGSVR